MNIFGLRSVVLADYRDLVRSFLVITDDGASKFVNDVSEKEARLWRDFLVQLSPFSQ